MHFDAYTCCREVENDVLSSPSSGFTVMDTRLDQTSAKQDEEQVFHGKFFSYILPLSGLLPPFYFIFTVTSISHSVILFLCWVKQHSFSDNYM